MMDARPQPAGIHGAPLASEQVIDAQVNLARHGEDDRKRHAARRRIGGGQPELRPVMRAAGQIRYTHQPRRAGAPESVTQLEAASLTRADHRLARRPYQGESAARYPAATVAEHAAPELLG